MSALSTLLASLATSLSAQPCWEPCWGNPPPIICMIWIFNLAPLKKQSTSCKQNYSAYCCYCVNNLVVEYLQSLSNPYPRGGDTLCNKCYLKLGSRGFLHLSCFYTHNKHFILSRASGSFPVSSPADGILKPRRRGHLRGLPLVREGGKEGGREDGGHLSLLTEEEPAARLPVAAWPPPSFCSPPPSLPACLPASLSRPPPPPPQPLLQQPGASWIHEESPLHGTSPSHDGPRAEHRVDVLILRFFQLSNMNHAFDISGHFAREHPFALASSITSVIRYVSHEPAASSSFLFFLSHTFIQLEAPFTFRVGLKWNPMIYCRCTSLSPPPSLPTPLKKIFDLICGVFMVHGADHISSASSVQQMERECSLLCMSGVFELTSFKCMLLNAFI